MQKVIVISILLALFIGTIIHNPYTHNTQEFRYIPEEWDNVAWSGD